MLCDSELHCEVGWDVGRKKGRREGGKIDIQVMTAMILVTNPHSSPLLLVHNFPHIPSTTTCRHSQMQLGQFLRQLTRLTEEFGIAVVLTNQVVADPGGTFTISMHDIVFVCMITCILTCKFI